MQEIVVSWKTNEVVKLSDWKADGWAQLLPQPEKHWLWILQIYDINNDKKNLEVSMIYEWAKRLELNVTKSFCK